MNLLGNPQPGWIHRPAGAGSFLPSPPVIRYDRVYVGLADGAYYALDRAQGRVCWRYPVAETPSGTAVPDPDHQEAERSLAAPAVFDGLLYLATPDGTLLALEAHRGARVWGTKLPAGPVTAVAVGDGLAYVGCGEGVVAALELKTGALVWCRELGVSVVGEPAAGDGLVFVHDQDGRLWAFAGQTGEVVWQAAVPGPGQPPVFAELLVVVGGRAYDPRSGELVWQVPEEAAPAVRGEGLLYPGGEVDLYTGAYRWRRDGGPAPGKEAPGTEPSGTSERPAGAESLIWAGNCALAVTPRGSLACWRLQTGESLWHLEPEAPICGPPALAPGLVALSLANGSLMTCKVRSEPRGRRGHPHPGG